MKKNFKIFMTEENGLSETVGCWLEVVKKILKFFKTKKKDRVGLRCKRGILALYLTRPK